MRSVRQRGNAIVEFTLVGIPMIFVLISIFEMSRGMWNYHTLAEAVKEGTRVAVVHGIDCTYNGNTCGIRVQDVANAIKSAAIGLQLSNLNATLTAGSAAPIVCGLGLTNCLNNVNAFPPTTNGNNALGTTITVSATYDFQSALALFWPGQATRRFGAVALPAYSSQLIQY